VPVLL
jgi:heat shock protein 90kDa beta